MRRLVLFVLFATVGSASLARAQTPDAKPTMEIYGFGMVDAIADFNQVNPD